MTPKLSCLDCGVPTARSRCDACFEKKKAILIPRQRLSTAARGYDSEWNRVRLSILKRDNFICYRCQKNLEGNDATVDHIIPLSRGGARLDRTNLAACCRSCNSQKKNK